MARDRLLELPASLLLGLCRGWQVINDDAQKPGMHLEGGVTSARRLAHVLLLLANFGKDGKLVPVIPRISQDVLAASVGTSRSRINAFKNEFRDLGFIEYNGDTKAHSGLLSAILHD